MSSHQTIQSCQKGDIIRHQGSAVELNDESQVPISRGKRDLFLLQMARLAK